MAKDRLEIGVRLERELERAGISIVEGIVPAMEQEVAAMETHTWTEEKEVKTCKEFYIIPCISTAIPTCPAASDILVEMLVKHGDLLHGQNLSDYPKVSEHHLHTCFPSFEVMPYRTQVTVTRPTWACEARSLRRLAVERAKKRVSSYTKRRNMATYDIEI